MGFRLLDFLLRRRRAVALSAAVFALAALIYVLVADPVYESWAMMMPPIEEGGEGLLSAWMASINVPAMITPMSRSSVTSAVMADILRSRGLAEMVIGSLGLREWYKSDTMDDAVRDLRASADIMVSQTGMITLRVRDRDPAMAMHIASRHITALDTLNRRIQFTRAESSVRFTAGQIEKFRERLRESREKIAEFQRQHGVIDFDQQVRGAIDIAAALKIKASLTAIELDLLREFATPDAAELRKKQLELKHINRQLEKIMTGDTTDAVFIPLRELPALYLEYAALQRDIAVNERVYSFLLEKHEESGIEKARNTPSVQIVDEPNLPEKRAGLPRWAVVALAAAAGALWMIACLGWWGWVSLRKRPLEEDDAFRSVVDTVRGDILALRRRLKI